MTLEELAALVRAMRTAQRNYFRTKGPTYLEESKTLEHRVDRALEALAAGPGLFDGPGLEPGGGAGGGRVT